MNDKRPYRSSLREDQTQRTRALIVDALIEQVCDSGRADLAMNQVAERAGVSVRTVYRHFPSREDLLGAITEEITSRSPAQVPTTLEELPEHMDALLAWFEDNPKLIEASHVAGLGREVRQRGRQLRGERARTSFDALLADRPEAERLRAWAVSRTLFSSQTWLSLRTELGLDAEQTRDAMGWLLGLMLDDLARRRAQPEDHTSQEQP